MIEEGLESADVIGMTMGQEYRIDIAEVDIQFPGIAHQQIRCPGIEQQRIVTCFVEHRQTMFGLEAFWIVGPVI